MYFWQDFGSKIKAALSSGLWIGVAWGLFSGFYQFSVEDDTFLEAIGEFVACIFVVPILFALIVAGLGIASFILFIFLKVISWVFQTAAEELPGAFRYGIRFVLLGLVAIVGQKLLFLVGGDSYVGADVSSFMGGSIIPTIVFSIIGMFFMGDES